jgi:hypothetical protein
VARLHLLVPEPVHAAAVRTLPRNAIAGHTPYIFVHAFLTDSETTAAAPAEGNVFHAAVTAVEALASSTGSTDPLVCGLAHGWLSVGIMLWYVVKAIQYNTLNIPKDNLLMQEQFRVNAY